ncbi:MAG: ABC transporter substrate-binding protein [Prevotella sp.]|nr:ABC transporter substrate-binding protein [Prevotella sp.]
MATHAQLKEVTFCPQWHPSVQFVGYMAACEMGFYKDEGLNVTIKYPEGTKSSLEMMHEGKADLVTTMLTSAIVAKANEGLSLVNVMQTSQHASLSIVLKSPVGKMSVESLRGLRVGIWSNRLSITAEAMNKIYDLNWTIVPFRNGIKLLSYGVLDAITMMEYNELLRLKYTGGDLSEHSVMRMCEHGYDIPEDGVYCLEAYYSKNPETVKAFVRATKKGWEWCRQHPEQAVDIATREMKKEYVKNSKVLQKAGLEVILRKQELTSGQIPYTLQSQQYEQATKILMEAELIQTIPDFQTFIAQ